MMKNENCGYKEDFSKRSNLIFKFLKQFIHSLKNVFFPVTVIFQLKIIQCIIRFPLDLNSSEKNCSIEKEGKIKIPRIIHENFCAVSPAKVSMPPSLYSVGKLGSRTTAQHR